MPGSCKRADDGVMVTELLLRDGFFVGHGRAVIGNREDLQMSDEWRDERTQREWHFRAMVQNVVKRVGMILHNSVYIQFRCLL